MFFSLPFANVLMAGVLIPFFVLPFILGAIFRRGIRENQVLGLVVMVAIIVSTAIVVCSQAILCQTVSAESLVRHAHREVLGAILAIEGLLLIIVLAGFGTMRRS